MGLDQYLEVIPESEGKPEDSEAYEEIAYWRKFNELQGYFERHYNQKNCGHTELDEYDIKEILEVLDDKELRDKELIHTDGFFYGVDAYDDDRLNYTIEAFKEAYKRVLCGDKVYYTCWY